MTGEVCFDKLLEPGGRDARTHYDMIFDNDFIEVLVILVG